MSTTVTQCPECNGSVERQGVESVCGSCGLVVGEDAIDPGPEWRSFEDDDTDRARTGAPLTRSRHDRGLSTKIGRSTRLKGRKRRRSPASGASTTAHRSARSASGTGVRLHRDPTYHQLNGAFRRDSGPGLCAVRLRTERGSLLGRTLDAFDGRGHLRHLPDRTFARTVDELCTVAKATQAELRAAYDALNRESGCRPVRLTHASTPSVRDDAGPADGGPPARGTARRRGTGPRAGSGT